jgi:glycosyltransferase involved in cell wall biosynthesis
MTIAVNTRLRADEQPEGYENFMFEYLNRLTKKYTEHQFLFIFDKPYAESLVFSKNVTPLIAGPDTKNNLRLQYWFNYKVPAVLRRYKADVFVSMDGICSMRTKKPQCLLIPDLRFINDPSLLKKSRAGFYQKFMPSFLLKAKSILTVSAFSKSVIADQYKIDTDKIEVLNYGIDELFKPLGPDEKEIIKETYSKGKEYFLFSGNINPVSNTINLLKAFSFFKKRQKSNMQLLIAGSPDEIFTKDLKTYKFRDEVIIMDNLKKEELAKITAAAYAMVHPVVYTDTAFSPLQAMQCNIPVVCSNTGALPSICVKAALYCNPQEFQDIAENMMLLFKDEDKVKELVNAGKDVVKQYHWEQTTEVFMQSILRAYNN